jgi:hypothetical protein
VFCWLDEAEDSQSSLSEPETGLGSAFVDGADLDLAVASLVPVVYSYLLYARSAKG